MKPELFQFVFLGNTIHASAYFVMGLTGFILSLSLMCLFAKKAEMPMGSFFLVVIMLTAMMALGARLLYVLHAPEQFNSIADVLKPSLKGYSVTGGLALAIVVSWPLLPALGFRRLKFWDMVAGPIAFGLALGRIGCFLTGCCFGKVTHSWVGVIFPLGSQPHLWQIREGIVDLFQAPLAVYPTQIFEMIALLIIGILAIQIRLLAHYVEGSASVISLLLYASFRLLNLFFRADPSGSLPVWVHSLGYVFAIIACARWIYLKNQKEYES